MQKWKRIEIPSAKGFGEFPNDKKLEALEMFHLQEQSHANIQKAPPSDKGDKITFNVTEEVNGRVDRQLSVEKEGQIWNFGAEQLGEASMIVAESHNPITTIVNWEVDEATPILVQ
ncbi:hypothetical protein HAX54_009270 [Datura stramonium]|uniref:Uncharacterized protein n=1 Tax=Datura stramonium TaxID=4076 RepID=A0ABS8RW06_DATST|nr:hypothetical protein [Datura stramonium]